MEDDPLLPVEVRRHLGDGLARQAEGIALEWREALAARLGERSERILPSAESREGVPAVVRHLTDALSDDEPPAEAVLEWLKALVELRRDQMYPVEETLLEVDLLARIFMQRLSALLRANPYISGPAAAASAVRLSNAARRLMSTVAALHHEDEEAGRGESSRETVATVKHELRSPLAVVSHSARILEKDAAPTPEERRAMAARLQRSVDRITELLDALGAEWEAPPARSESPGRSLREVLGDVLSDIRPLADRVSIAVEGDVPDVPVDAANTAVVSHNLLTNAVKYADPRKPEPWVRLRVRATEDPGVWRVEVDDNGLGISADALERIFDRSVRSHEDRAEGRGLGLAIARDAVERMGGRIGCESREGEGSTFFFTVPERSSRASPAA